MKSRWWLGTSIEKWKNHIPIMYNVNCYRMHIALRMTLCSYWIGAWEIMDWLNIFFWKYSPYTKGSKYCDALFYKHGKFVMAPTLTSLIFLESLCFTLLFYFHGPPLQRSYKPTLPTPQKLRQQKVTSWHNNDSLLGMNF